MKLNTAPANPVEMNGVASTNQFTIRASAKAFSILSDGLYANKIRAIVRELSTNALDSHIAAARADLPFTVNIPNLLAPWFSVRDYGVGLSHEEVVSIYTSYFTSTKSDSDDFVGALGLGSKSPFSYTDNFTVTAIKDGRKGLYSAYIDDTGVPSIALMSESETDEPAGVEVRLAVNNRDDFFSFAKEAEYVYRHFTVRPEFTGQTVEFEDIEYYRRDIVPGVHLRKHGRLQNNTVVMGSIEYPIRLPHGALPDDLLDLNNQGIEIHVPIGAVEMAASREELSYTARTIETITQAYSKVNANLESAFLSDAAKLTNEWDRASFVQEKRQSNLFAKIALRYLRNNPSPLLDVSGGYYVSCAEINLPVADAEKLNIKLHVVDVGYHSDPTRSEKNIQVQGDDGKLTNIRVHRFKANPERLLFVNGSASGSITRVKNWARKDSFYGDVIVATPINRKEPVLWDKFLEAIHNPPDNMIKGIEEFPESEKRERAKATPVYQFTLESKTLGSPLKTVMRPYGNLVDIKADGETTTYVKLYRSETHLNGEPFDLRQAMVRLHESGLLAEKKIRVFGFRGEDFNQIAENPDWIAFDVAADRAVNNLTVEDFATAYMKILDKNWKRIYNNSILKRDLVNSPVMSIAAYYKESSQYSFCAVENLVTQFGNKEVQKRLAEAKTLVDKIISMYPLVEKLDNWTDLQLISDYIKLVDNAKGEKA